MFLFLGSYSGGGGGGSLDDDDSQDEESTDDHTQTGVDDFSEADETADSEENVDSDAGTAAGIASAAGSAAAAGTAGSGAGAGSITEPPEDEDSRECTEAEEDSECEDEKEIEPESPDLEEPDTEEEEGTHESNQEEDPEEDIEDRDKDEDDTEENEAVVVVQEVDPLSAMSWSVQPVMKCVEERYGEEIELFYRPAPIRDLDPKQEKQKWIECSEKLDMPVDPSFWDDNPPESTELVNRAFQAAIQQGQHLEYLRAMWRNGVAAGRDISSREALIDLASDLGFDTEHFEKDLDKAKLESGERDELPFTHMEIHGKSVPKNGRVRYVDFQTQFTFQDVDEQRPQELQGFVREHGPVATVEVMEVYRIQREEAVQRLSELDDVSSFEIGGEDFWEI